MISACRYILLSFAKLLKAKSVKIIGIWVDSFICMNGTRRDGDDRARGNRHTVGKCERAQHETVHGNWGGEEEWISISYLGGNEEGIQRMDG